MEKDVQNTENSRGVILLSTGCPAGREDVRGFIKRILSDADAVSLPLWRGLSHILAPMIASFRKKKVVKRYEAIGGFTKLAETTDGIASRMRERLDIEVKAAYRYSLPTFYDVLSEFKEKDINRIIAIPLNPQFSISTNGSFIAHLLESLGKLKQGATVFSSFYRNETFIDLTTRSIKNTMTRKAAGLEPGSAHFMFVAHSVPVRNLKLNDPYVAQIEEMVMMLGERLNITDRCSLAFQSSAGPIEWVGPQADDHVKELARRDIESLVVVPLSFVVENLETLYDLDIELKKTAGEHGIKQYLRIPTVGEDEAFAEFLCGLVDRVP